MSLSCVHVAHCAWGVYFSGLSFFLSLQDYITVKDKGSVYLPHTAGRYAAKRFRKAQCPIVERLTNSLMMHGRNNGKKLMAVSIVKHSFEIIHLLTGEVSSLWWSSGSLIPRPFEGRRKGLVHTVCACSVTLGILGDRFTCQYIIHMATVRVR